MTSCETTGDRYVAGDVLDGAGLRTRAAAHFRAGLEAAVFGRSPVRGVFRTGDVFLYFLKKFGQNKNKPIESRVSVWCVCMVW
jgi:hypothetical protein